jgi:pyruvate-formate lyase-activating enzyme
MSEFVKNPAFCAAPWLHYYRSPTGQRALCCIAEPFAGDNSLQTFEETQNSPDFRQARLSMMKGEVPPQCQRCVASPTVVPYRKTFNRTFLRHFEEIQSQTAADGSTKVEPRGLDFRITICNLNCLTCNPDFSSRWIRIARELEGKPAGAAGDTAFLRSESKRVIRKYEWEQVYFAGGEPLLMPGHIEDLEALLALEKRSRIPVSIVYSTNLQHADAFLDKWVDILNQFRSVLLQISIDAYGRTNDLVRIGSVFARTEQSLLRLRSRLHRQVNTQISTVMTSLLVSDLDPFVDWVLKQEIPVGFTSMIGTGYLGKILRVENLKLAYREGVLEGWKKRFASLKLQERALLKEMDAVLREQLLATEFSPEEKQQALAQLARLPFEGIPEEIRARILPLM